QGAGVRVARRGGGGGGPRPRPPRAAGPRPGPAPPPPPLRPPPPPPPARPAPPPRPPPPPRRPAPRAPPPGRPPPPPPAPAPARLPLGLPEPIGRITRLALDGQAGAAVAELRSAGFIKPQIRVDPQRLLDYLGPILDPLRTETFQFSRKWLRREAARIGDPR